MQGAWIRAVPYSIKHSVQVGKVVHRRIARYRAGEGMEGAARAMMRNPAFALRAAPTVVRTPVCILRTGGSFARRAAMASSMWSTAKRASSKTVNLLPRVCGQQDEFRCPLGSLPLIRVLAAHLEQARGQGGRRSHHLAGGSACTGKQRRHGAVTLMVMGIGYNQHRAVTLGCHGHESTAITKVKPGHASPAQVANPANPDHPAGPSAPLTLPPTFYHSLTPKRCHLSHHVPRPRCQPQPHHGAILGAAGGEQLDPHVPARGAGEGGVAGGQVGLWVRGCGWEGMGMQGEQKCW